MPESFSLSYSFSLAAPLCGLPLLGNEYEDEEEESDELAEPSVIILISFMLLLAWFSDVDDSKFVFVAFKLTFVIVVDVDVKLITELDGIINDIYPF